MTRPISFVRFTLIFMAPLFFWIYLLPSAADEGMFPISELDELNLVDEGLNISVSDLFSADQTCLVDGICRVNGCTGSLVSPQGLIITNHHCAYRAIQSVSKPANDILKNGFTAKTLAEEIPATGYVVRITESYQDITEQVLSALLPTMSFLERAQALEKRQKELEHQAEVDNPGRRAEVAEMFAGKTYALFLYTYLKDVRIVFAPPESVGNFGGDVDNWEWPRHTGDFSFMRAYVAPDGSSADYHADNVPYQPKKFIRIDPAGVEEDDFVFLLGYPGRTARHKTASFLQFERDVRLPFIVEHGQWQIGVMEEQGLSDRSIALKHTNTIKSLANTEKRSRGQLKGLRIKKIVETRLAEEEKLQAFIDADPDRKSKYGTVLSDIAAVYQAVTEQSEYELNLKALIESSKLLGTGFALIDAAVERSKFDLEREPEYMDRNFDQTKKKLLLSLQDLHLSTDRILTTGVLARLQKTESAQRIPAFAKYWRDASTFDSYVDSLYQAGQLTDVMFVEKALDQLTNETGLIGRNQAISREYLEVEAARLSLVSEPAIELVIGLYPEYVRLREQNKSRSGQLDQLYGKLIEVKQEFLKTNFIPDANSTLRLTYGHVKGYSPVDAVYKLPITTFRGVVEKTTGIEPFITPQKMLEAHAAKAFAGFAHPTLNDIPTAILYDTDTTGGNSGSPILNATGELVGVNFDRAFEATINDFAWDSSYSRSIGVDIRYVLWITGPVYGAEHLLEEMGVTR